MFLSPLKTAFYAISDNRGGLQINDVTTSLTLVVVVFLEGFRMPDCSKRTADIVLGEWIV